MPDTRTDLSRAAVIYFAGALVFAVFVARNLAVHLRFEDALIVLRYARNLVEGHGFVFNPGERVLGVTTPLQTLISTLYVAVSPDNAPALQNLAGLAFLIGEGFMVLLLAWRMGRLWLGFPAALLALSNFNLNYLYFGMEVHLFAMLVLLAFYLFLENKQGICGVVLGLAFLTRYDAALMAALIGMALLLEKRRLPWRLTLGFAVTVAPWLVFAQLYFGSILPNPLGAKEGYYTAASYLHRVFFEYKAAFKNLIELYVPVEIVKAGLSYLFLVPVLTGAVASAWSDRRWIVLGLYPFLHVTTYAWIGSDPGFTWHYHILNPVFYLFFAAGLHVAIRVALRFVPLVETRLAKSRPLLTVLTVAVMLPVLHHLFLNMKFRYQTDLHTKQLYAMSSWLRENYSEATSLLQPAIGILGYETNFRMIDHAGLITPGLFFFDDANCTPMDEVLARFEPDLVLLSEASRADVTAFGYREVKLFEGALRYTLYERGP